MKVEQGKDTAGIILKLEGPIDEDALFPQVSPKQGEGLSLALENVTLINSCGIREWIRWITPLAGQVKITLKNCPKVIVDQVNTVDGFLPKGVGVESFFVSYYCESCSNTTALPFETNKVVRDGKIEIPPSVTCGHCKKAEAEMDVIPQKYFSFLGEIE